MEVARKNRIKYLEVARLIPSSFLFFLLGNHS
nr:MAG TPA: hypothetical protein [Caudoviricetes sp.]